MNLSPIALFVYRRPEHTQRTLEALATNDLAHQSTLYIYSDGPEHFASPGDIARLARVREIIRSRQWCGEVKIIESDYNRGLADSIVFGVTSVVNRHGRVIVLEDDIVTRKGYLRFMNNALETYDEEPRVMHVSGMIYGCPKTATTPTAFLRIMSCHGWGTWKRAWAHYIHDPHLLMRTLRAKSIGVRQFDIHGHATFYRQLQRNCEGTLNTWAVKWYASWLTAGGYSLFPHRSLVTNIGHDGTGVHVGAEFFNGQTVDSLPVERIPVEENMVLRREMDRIWKQGLKNARKRQHLTVRQRLKAVLMPFRPLGRRLLGFFYPELAMLDQASPLCAVIANSLRGSEISEKARVYPPYCIRDSRVGEYTYVASHARISATTIGKFCSVGPHLVCGGGWHPTDGISTSPMFYSTRMQNGVSLCSYDKAREQRPITIGNDVFIGMNVTILDGVNIGDGAVIGAGAVVSKDIPPYAIAVGCPIKLLRYRFDKALIQNLLRVNWWNFSETHLDDVEKRFFDIEVFINEHSPGTVDSLHSQDINTPPIAQGTRNP